MLDLRKILCIMALALCWMSGHAQFRNPAIQLRSNALFDAAASPNIGFEIQTDMGVAWEFDYTGAWWTDDPLHKYFANYAFQTELRYYFESPVVEMPYTGHHVGVFGQLLTFDFEFGGKGIMNRDLDKGWGVGVSYGYVQKLSKSWSVDFTIGIGYLDIMYEKYLPTSSHRPDTSGYVRTGINNFEFFGPTKLEVSFIWNINYTNHPKYLY